MKKNLVGLTLLASTFGWIATTSPIMAKEWGAAAGKRAPVVARGVGYGHGDRANKPRHAPAPVYTAPRRANRVVRRRASVQKIQSRWGAGLIQTPAVRTELKLHAERMARLDRMKVLARQGKNRGLVTRIDVLIQRENARHQARMASLQKIYYSRR